MAHDPSTRGIDREDLESTGLRSFDSVDDVVRNAMHLLSMMSGRKESVVARELAEVFSYRILFLLLPEECLFGSPVRDKPVLREHLLRLGITPTEDLVRGLKFLVDNFRMKTRRESQKTSITDVFVRAPRVYDEILNRQNGRCATCGVPLAYGLNMQLDHVLPWHLGDDPLDGSNWQFLCERCNRGKGILPHYSLSVHQANWIRPKESHALSDDVRYAALKRDGRCSKSGRGPRDTELFVEKAIETGCWVLDNLVVVARDDF